MTRIAIAAALGAALLLTATGWPAASEPYSCQMLREAERKCAANTIGPCYVRHEVDRLRKQCIREGGKP